MKIIIHRLAGVGFGAALAIMLSVDVEAAPMNTSRAQRKSWPPTAWS